MRKTKLTTQKLKIVLAGLCLLCLTEMPYSYYEIFRVIAFTSFIFLAYKEKDKSIWPLLWITSAILVQPFFKFYITRGLWMFIDFVWACLLLYPIFKKSETKENNEIL